MSFNRVVKKVPFGTIKRGADEIILSVATETLDWIRPETVATQQGPGFQKAVEAAKHLVPDGTKEICQRSLEKLYPHLKYTLPDFANRETQHSSDEDRRDHYTGVCFNETGDGKSVHFPIQREK
ncbi:hypothetical protein BO78DRAFT_416169 [Aspergillus sclerotiicarbonarius CBS 121057]|uniref:Uncharacterized protein n=1 Tax=Aspergillus sclerotiicarbonarius (strain CBS 121057 / IBT 28362) TaxID=1448318 RepID=A0A319EF64_ASPSB|nr:hypothetical protein BO78DRAFT_416169 [Aspergillus sclerotiicarbonarius CBS 121057]